ncbi:hypothetical protein CBR_g46843 [Chara braunii]|uniref:Uncharacterized protein n=1 Tax=Chara braunii TaxID=69332 RepID=A0A388M124_CHABU|nr:hypothetical protein CBR_g46843 [Chara braunii]|eukprot:GBG88277.1 hypothetical protein CBR_g46843 [Chara braunii]
MDAAQEGPRSNGGALRSRRGDAGAEKDKRSSLVVRSRGVAGQTRRLIKDAQGWYQGQDHGRDQDMADASHPEEETQKSKASFPTRKFADEKLETGSYTPPSLVLQTRKGSGHSQRCGWPVLLWVLGAIGSWSGVGYGLWLSWKESSQAHVHLQHAMWLSQIGLLCLSLAMATAASGDT